jgi:signal transduction histidine kinase
MTDAAAIPLRCEQIDVRALLASSMEVLEEQAKSLDIALRVDSTANVPKSVCVDPEKVAWAVATLVGNAFRHVKRGTWRKPGGSIEVKLDYSKEKDELSILVEDDGPGIPAEKLPWRFEREPGATQAGGLGPPLLHPVAEAPAARLKAATLTASVLTKISGS